MSDIFNFRRFGKYLGADLSGAWSKYGVILLTAGLLNVFGYLLLRVCFGWSYTFASIVIFVFAGIFLIISISSFLYGHITDNRKGADYILLPASQLEKYLSIVLICAIIAPAIYIAVYFGTDSLFAAADPAYESMISFFKGLTLGNYWFVMALLAGIQTCTIFLLGALVFKKHKITYTILVLLGLFIVVGIIDFATVGGVEGVLNAVIYDNKWLYLIWLIVWQILIFIAIYLKLKKIQH